MTVAIIPLIIHITYCLTSLPETSSTVNRDRGIIGSGGKSAAFYLSKCGPSNEQKEPAVGAGGGGGGGGVLPDDK